MDEVVSEVCGTGKGLYKLAAWPDIGARAYLTGSQWLSVPNERICVGGETGDAAPDFELHFLSRRHFSRSR